MFTSLSNFASVGEESLLAQLRSGTRDLQEHIERRMNLPDRFSSRAEYRRMLGRFYGLYAPLERTLGGPDNAAGWAALGLDFEPRRKAHLLRANLTDLGLTEPEIDALPLRPTEPLPTARSIADLIGCIYVLEGSTLGGQIIGKHVEPTLGLLPGGRGARYFWAYGPQTGAKWQEFRHATEIYWVQYQTGARPGTKIAGAAISAARRTFGAMDAWLLSTPIDP